MSKILLLDGKYLYYDEGKFDKFCVYEVDSEGRKKAPRDVEYFTELASYIPKFGKETLYQDFVQIYNLTTKEFDEKVPPFILKLTAKYGESQTPLFRIFSILYMGMISEENKERTKLGKRIKRLGIYSLLILEKSPSYCADFTKGKSASDIDKWCREGGF